LKVEFKRSFVKDLERVKDKGLKERVTQTIERVEEAKTLQEIGKLKSLRSGELYYRITVGDYRLGLMLEGDTAILVRFLHRKDIYRYFP